MSHELLGKKINTPEGLLTIGFLRADHDAGIGIAYAERGAPEYLVKLSTQSVIRKLKVREDFDTAVLSA